MNLYLVRIFIVFCVLVQGKCLAIGSLELNNNYFRQADSIYYSEPQKALLIYEKIESKSRRSKDSLSLAKSLVSACKIYLLFANYEKVNENLHESFDLYQRLNDLSGQADVMKMRSLLYTRLERKSKANEALAEAIELYRKDENHEGMIRSLFNYSLNCMELSDLVHARKALDQLEALETWMDLSDHYYLYQNSGLYEFYSGKIRESLPWFEKAFLVAQQSNMIDALATINMLKGNTYLALNELGRAEEFLTKSYAIAEDNKLDFEKSSTLNSLITLYERKGDFQSAFKALKELSALKEKMLNADKLTRINQLENRIQLTSRENELAKAQLELEQAKRSQSRIETENMRLVLGSLILFLIAGFSLALFLRTRILKGKITVQAKKLEHKNHLLEEAYNDITSNLEYAKRIQHAMLPSPKIVTNYLKHSFILHLPKNIVSGDFYWMDAVHFNKSKRHQEFKAQLKNPSEESLVLFAACDCSGSGLSGAMLSVVAHNALNRAVHEYNCVSPAAILDKVNELVRESLHQSEASKHQIDLIDCSLCVYAKKSQQLFWAGANNPLWILRDETFIIYEGDRVSIGLEENTLFTSHKIELKLNDCVYIFSDGFADQFGGTEGKKLKQKRFKDLLIKISNKDMNEQSQFLKVEFDNWKGDLEQIDDVCVIAVKIAE